MDAARLRTPPGDWSTYREHLLERLPRVSAARLDEMLAAGRFVDDHGNPISGTAEYQANRFLWFHRDLPDEVEIAAPIPVLAEDERILVVDKPHFLSVIPRGQHVMQSVIVKLRAALELPELGAAHRLDRGTAGVLLLVKTLPWRAAYQTLFERRQIAKVYEAIAPLGQLKVGESITVRSHISKERGVLQAVDSTTSEPNAITKITLMAATTTGLGRYRLEPLTGKTHQLRLHMLRLGTPICHDALYPKVLDVGLDDFTRPLQLLARSLAFTDPIDKTTRSYHSTRQLDCAASSDSFENSRDTLAAADAQGDQGVTGLGPV